MGDRVPSRRLTLRLAGPCYGAAMTRAPLLRALAAAGLLLNAAAPAASPGEEPSRPNILFVFTDDHAPHAIGAYGSPYAALDPTPHIDRLAREGMLFRNSFCTNSICGPSRAVIQTGKHSHRNGFRDNGDRFNGDQTTFPKLLQAAGYDTALFGKWHLGTTPQGFDAWEVLPGQGDYYNPKLIGPEGERVIEGYCTDIVTDLAVEWLDAREDPEAPFLLMCQHKAPHRNWMPAPRHLDLYDGVELPEPATLFDRHEDDASPARLQEMEIDRDMSLVYDLFVDPWEGWDPKAGFANDGSGFRNLGRMTAEQRAAWDAAYADENAAFLAAGLQGEALVRWTYQRYMKNYLRTIRGVDDSVGRLLAALEERGLAQNTVVVYSSDQGFYLGDHGWFDKRWMYEESLRMPLIVRWPGVVPANAVDEHLVQNLDYAQTFLELAGVEAPADMQGLSLAPLLRGEDPGGWRDAIYYHYYAFPSIHRVARHYGIRTARWKLIRHYQFDEWELFDLEADPDELTNLYGRPGLESQTRDLKRRLLDLRVQYGDTSDVSIRPAAWRQRFEVRR
jgi:arylsulfatase A-like enzyme